MKPERLLVREDFAGTLRRAAECFLRGGVVVFPTETVYGVGVAAGDAAALGRLREIKRRDGGKPFQRLAADVEMAERLGTVFSPSARRLAEKFWPGPLTLVLPAKAVLPASLRDNANGSAIATANDSVGESADGTLGVRVPAFPWVLEVCRLLASPIVSSSANEPGLPPALDGEAAWEFALAVGADLFIDGGAIPGGVASTVARCNGNDLQILRQGALPEADLRAVWRDSLTE